MPSGQSAMKFNVLRSNMPEKHKNYSDWAFDA